MDSHNPKTLAHLLSISLEDEVLLAVKASLQKAVRDEIGKEIENMSVEEKMKILETIMPQQEEKTVEKTAKKPKENTLSQKIMERLKTKKAHA